MLYSLLTCYFIYYYKIGRGLKPYSLTQIWKDNIIILPHIKVNGQKHNTGFFKLLRNDEMKFRPNYEYFL